MSKQLTPAQLRRLPSYIEVLSQLKKRGVAFVNANQVADELGYNCEKVRKDIQAISTTSGVPNRGRKIDDLINDIEGVLGASENHNAILIGCGSLGKALLKYAGFKHYGLKIVAAFDQNKELIGKEINGIKVYDFDDLRDIKRNLNACIGIICVPKEYAQSVAYRLVACGIEAIWNFAPIKLDINDDVIVSNMDMAQSLATLAHHLFIKKNKQGEK